MTALPGRASGVPDRGYALALETMLTGLREEVAAGSEWETILRQVPRHLFAPSVGWAYPGSSGAPPQRLINRDIDSREWLNAVYSDMTIITQRDDGARDPASPDGVATSSLSAPSIVMTFLSLLQPMPRDRVLEVGTGTGWTAALLAARCGDDHVTSIEIDPAVHAAAAANLRAVGRSPRLILGDGAVGVPGQVFDRLHVSCGVRDIPPGWIAQLRPGGTAVFPWHPNGGDGWQVKLTACGDGTATGTFHGNAGYMMLRAQRTGPALWRSHHGDLADVTSTSLDPGQVAEAGRAAILAISAACPDLTVIAGREPDGTAFVHVAETGNLDGSWAACDATPDGPHIVTQYGPRRLWGETEAAFTQWDVVGRPGPERYRLNVTPAGQHIELVTGRRS